MTHDLTVLERLRVRIATRLHAALIKRGYYAETTATEDSYALTVPMAYADLEERLHSLRFVRNLASSAKYRQTSTTDRDIGEASWVYFPQGLARSEHQLHLDLFIGPERDQTDVYAHWEPSWVTNPIRHYRAKEVDSLLGIRLAREMFTSAGIGYTTVPAELRYGPLSATHHSHEHEHAHAHDRD